jgi:hypothetical protein
VNINVAPCFWNRKTEFECAITSRIWHYTIVSVAMIVGSIALTWIWFFLFDWTREQYKQTPKSSSQYTSLDSFTFTYKSGRIQLSDELNGLKPTVGVMTAGPSDFVAKVKHISIEKGLEVYCESFI